MMKKIALILLSLIACLSLYGCGQTTIRTVEVEKTLLSTPELYIVEGNKINCQEIEGVEVFEVEYIYEDTNVVQTVSVSEMPYDVPSEEPGVYSVRARAIPASNTENFRSLWSDYIQFVSLNRDKIATPQNVRGEEQTIRWGNIRGAIGYEVDIDGKVYSVKTNSYTDENLLPGTEYKIKVRAIIDENIYTASSDWSKEIIHKYTVVFPAPTNVSRNSSGVFSWMAEKPSVTGYTVSYKSSADDNFTDVVVYENRFNTATLPSGDYTIKVKVNGIGDNPSSEYSDEKSVRITRCYNWTPSDIVSKFTSWNNCTVGSVGGNAAMKSGAGWGGIISPEITLNYDRNPVLVIDYAKVNYGYMGKYLTANNENGYYYVGDTKGEFEDLTLSYLMSKHVSGSLPNAVGTQTGIRILIGFAGASESSDNSRVVSEVKGLYIAYVEDIA